MVEDYDYDLDYNPDALHDSMYGDYGDYFADGADYTLRDLKNDCLIPTLYDGVTSSSKLLICCILLKFKLSLSKFILKVCF